MTGRARAPRRGRSPCMRMNDPFRLFSPRPLPLLEQLKRAPHTRIPPSWNRKPRTPTPSRDRTPRPIQDHKARSSSDGLSVAGAFMGRLRREAHHDGEGTVAVPVIGEYERADGTRVRRHWRAPAGTRRQTAIALGIVAVVVIFANSGTAATGSPGTERLPEPGPSTASYPITRPGTDRPAPRSTPPVKYPIKWPGWKEPAPRPTPTVSYPIKWERDGDGQ